MITAESATKINYSRFTKLIAPCYKKIIELVTVIIFNPAFLSPRPRWPGNMAQVTGFHNIAGRWRETATTRPTGGTTIAQEVHLSRFGCRKALYCLAFILSISFLPAFLPYWSCLPSFTSLVLTFYLSPYYIYWYSFFLAFSPPSSHKYSKVLDVMKTTFLQWFSVFRVFFP